MTSSILYAFAVLPIGKHEKEQLDITQRKMMRLIVGWTRHAGEDWDITMQRMKDRVQCALDIFPIMTWTESFHRNRWRFAAHAIKSTKSRWTYLLAQWIPCADNYGGHHPYRAPGRPRLRWDDSLHAFCQVKLNIRHWCDLEVLSLQEICAKEDEYVEYCQTML